LTQGSRACGGGASPGADIDGSVGIVDVAGVAIGAAARGGSDGFGAGARVAQLPRTTHASANFDLRCTCSVSQTRHRRNAQPTREWRLDCTCSDSRPDRQRMEAISDTDVAREKLRLDEERLALEKLHQQQEDRFLRRNSPVIIASLVPFIVATISLVQMRNSSLNDRRERLINYVKYINDNVRELRTSDDVTLHRQTAYMTSAVLDPEDRCPTLAYIANTVAKNRTIREIYESEAQTRGCKSLATTRMASSGGRSRASLIPIAAADSGESPQDVRAIYVYRQKRDGAGALADAVVQKLNDMGYNVPGENTVDTKPAQNEIRFFNKRDAAAARTVQSELAAALGTHFVVTDYSSKTPDRPGFLEIYVSD
jgi:hypothetical protein